MATNTEKATLRPVAFMVMPFRKRKIPSTPKGAPNEVDFDALWDRAFRPVLEDLGYLPVRADMETGTVIIKDMLERLKFADLVLADLTLPNGNVYYEVGIRHVAQKTNCVLISADWSKQLFDVDQFRSLRYPLADGTVPEEKAEEIKVLLKTGIEKHKNSITPYHELVTTKTASSVFSEQLKAISDFQADVRSARIESEPLKRKKLVSSLVENFAGSSLELTEIAFELLTLVRDNLSWEEMLEFVKKLPIRLNNHNFTKEQTFLAKTKLGDHAAAIAGLEELIKLQGESPERRGLIGGCYKKLWRKERDERVSQGKSEPILIEQGYLDDAIENYRVGASLDLNEYYCLCNLPGLLRFRDNPGDQKEAEFLDKMTILVTKRKIERGEDDGWARSTLLGTAFRVADASEVERLLIEVVKEGPAIWQLKSTMEDINDAVKKIADLGTQKQLMKYRDQLVEMIESF